MIETLDSNFTSSSTLNENLSSEDVFPYIAMQSGSRYWIMPTLTINEIQERLPILLIVQTKGPNFYVTVISYKGRSMFSFTYSELDLPIKKTHRDLSTIELSLFLQAHLKWFFSQSISLNELREALDTIDQNKNIIREDHDLSNLSGRPTTLEMILHKILKDSRGLTKRVAILYDDKTEPMLHEIFSIIEEKSKDIVFGSKTKTTNGKQKTQSFDDKKQDDTFKAAETFLMHTKNLQESDAAFISSLLLYKQLHINIAEIFPEGSEDHAWSTVISALFRKDLYTSWRDLDILTNELGSLLNSAEKCQVQDKISFVEKAIEILTKPSRFNAIQSISVYYSQSRDLQGYVTSAEEKAKQLNIPSLFKEAFNRGNTYKSVTEVCQFFSKVGNWLLTSKSRLDVLLESIHPDCASISQLKEFYALYDQLLRHLDKEVSEIALHVLMQQCTVAVDTWKHKLSQSKVLHVSIVRKVRSNPQQTLGSMYTLMVLSDRLFLLKNILDSDLNDPYLPPLLEPNKILSFLQSKNEVLMVKKCWMLNECFLSILHPSKLLECTDSDGTQDYILIKGEIETLVALIEQTQCKMTYSPTSSISSSSSLYTPKWIQNNHWVYVPVTFDVYQEQLSLNLYDHVLNLTNQETMVPGSSSTAPVLSSCISFSTLTQEKSTLTNEQENNNTPSHFKLKCQYLDPQAHRTPCEFQKKSTQLQGSLSSYLHTLHHLHQHALVESVFTSFARRRYSYLRNHVIGNAMQDQVQTGNHQFYSPSDTTGMSTTPSSFSTTKFSKPTSPPCKNLNINFSTSPTSISRSKKGVEPFFMHSPRFLSPLTSTGILPLDRISLKPSLLSIFSFRERSTPVISQTTLRSILQVIYHYVQHYVSSSSPSSSTVPPKKPSTTSVPSKRQLLLFMKEKKVFKEKYLMQAPPMIILVPLCEYILLLGSLANVALTVRLQELVQHQRIGAVLPYQDEVYQALYLEQDELKRQNLILFIQLITQFYPIQHWHASHVRDALFLSYYNSPHSSKRLDTMLDEVEHMVQLLNLVKVCPLGQLDSAESTATCMDTSTTNTTTVVLETNHSTLETTPFPSTLSPTKLKEGYTQDESVVIQPKSPLSGVELGDSAASLRPVLEEGGTM